MDTKPAFVLGNGRSRLAASLTEIKQHGRIYGCNALYRDFKPHVLVATDPGITAEIEASGYPIDNIFYTRKPNTQLGSRLITKHFGFSSGPIAAKLAADAGHGVVFLLGFDLQGSGGLQNNVYASTDNYRHAGDKATYHGNWVRQLSTVFDEHPNQQFIRLIGHDGIVPYEWMQKSNHHTIALDDFLPSINNKPWLRLKELMTSTR